jgi:MinD-like ATPase involved in chromosome partitioning or flagellar assembly
LLNRADSGYGIRQQDVESSIGRKISHSVVSDGRTVVYALNRGVPFVVAARQTRVAEDVVRIATAVLQGEPDVAPEIALRQIPKKGLFQWRAH